MQAVQTTLVSGVLSVVSDWNCSVPSGDPKWKPTAARQSSEVLERGERGVRAHRAKAEWVEIRHEDFWIDVLQIPREALALQL